MTTFIQQLQDCRETARVGGKGANLGKLVRAGFPVPGGFVIDTTGYHAAQQALGIQGVPHEIPPAIADSIRQAYRALGGGPVAVRSSATAEDMAAASMAGQYETFLDVVGEDQLLEKVQRCWASLDTPRIRAYLQEHGIDRSLVAMAVVVQKLVPADVAGVLFTINPNGKRGGKNEMLIEASWGLGESVVSGRVQPDILRLNAQTGAVIEAVIADKRTMLAAGSHAERPVEESRRKLPCLDAGGVRKLWELGTRAAQHFGAPQDIEWAIHNGELFLLQSRPITTHLNSEAQDELLAAARADLHNAAAAGRGPWVLHNLAETLAHPTPLTWSVIRPFMSGGGGFGNMYRQAGFEPSPRVRQEGFLDLIAGRIYMDASRAPEMFFENFPFAYDVEILKRTPDASQSPPTLPRGTLRTRMAAGRRLESVNAGLRKLSENVDRTLREEFFPQLAEYVARAKEKNLQSLGADALIDLWKQHESRVLDQFGGLSLMPSLICGMALGELRSFLEQHLWREDADALAQSLSAGGLANRTVIADAELYEVALGERSATAWLADHGHRAPGEFDLAAPRWREQPKQLLDLASRLTAGERPLERHRRSSEDANHRVATIRARLPLELHTEFDRRLDLVRRYMPFREDAKDYFMLGYDLLRDLALEAGRRLGIGADIFHLTREELFASLKGQPITAGLVDARKRTYRAEERLTIPHVIDAPALNVAPFAPEDAASTAATTPTHAQGGHKAFPISSGRAKGRARILLSPTQAGPLEQGYILVCPSTDPSWTPLFVNAAALIIECGGTLSHGAVVAREMGLPAVVIPDATRLFKDGDEIIVDGDRGWAGTAAEQTQKQTIDPNDTTVPRLMIPPIPGPKDRRAAKIRNICACIWAVFIAAFFLLPPAWASGPTLVFIDHFLWPIARFRGRGWVVVVVAAVIAVTTLLLQRFLTDNARLREAKRRATALMREADRLPHGSPRRRALQALAAPVQLRTLMAALVPVGILLGPMLLPFIWFKDRIDPAVWNAERGTPVQLRAFIDAAHTGPVTVQVPPGVTLDVPATQALPPIRAELEHLLALYNSPDAATAWEVQSGPTMSPQAAAASLKAYLDAGIPPQALRWQLTPPPNFSGKYTVQVSTGKFTSSINIILGNDFPPAPALIPGTGPIKELRVEYTRPSTENHFWRPFHFLAPLNQLPLVPALAAWDAGWLWLYIIAYIPILFITRFLLRVA